MFVEQPNTEQRTIKQTKQQTNKTKTNTNKQTHKQGRDLGELWRFHGGQKQTKKETNLVVCLVVWLAKNETQKKTKRNK